MRSDGGGTKTMQGDAGDSPREKGEERVTKRERKGAAVNNGGVSCKRRISNDSECECVSDVGNR